MTPQPLHPLGALAAALLFASAGCAQPVSGFPGATEVNEVSHALRVRCEAEYDRCRHGAGALASARERCEKERRACDAGEAAD